MGSTKDRTRGCLIGAALGDALGYPVEFARTPKTPRVAETGIILYSDDTQLSLASARGLLRNPYGGVACVAEFTALEFIKWLHDPKNNRAPGSACLAGARRLESLFQEHGTPLFQELINSGPINNAAGSGGSGALMRSHVYGLAFCEREAAVFAAKLSRLTHSAPFSEDASAEFAATIQHVVNSGRWLEDHHFVETIRDEQLRGKVADALTCTPEEALDRYRGWAADDAWAAAVCVARRAVLGGWTFSEAIHVAAASPGDSDTVASVVGALFGAYLGWEKVKESIPWYERLEDFWEILAVADELYALRQRMGVPT